ncbi:hypothetical protein MLD38_029632 [Melastoma candidum]|uniref:Uncharacterized protein n=1 Tax=Melastoma candidum TaxID=119954 RepID=A0ACB9NA06_9MYRT|nr:hypothetical protein MLD38_029632 [Melastoma candidum]
MESAKGQETTPSIFAEILPPRLEDAGLEDCALPPESVKEAFMKAALAVKSRASSLLSPSTEEGDLVSGPIPEGLSDHVVGADVAEWDHPCVVEKGGGGEPRGDLATPEVVEGGVGDRVVVPGMEGDGKGACVSDGPLGEAETGLAAAEEEEGSEDEPSLVEGVVRSSA